MKRSVFWRRLTQPNDAKDEVLYQREHSNARAARSRLSVCLLLLLSSCHGASDSAGEGSFREREHISVPTQYSACAKLVDRYIASTKQWSEQDYKVSFERAKADATDFQVAHIEDSRHPSTVGSGMSVLVQVNCSSGRIVRELAYQ